MVEEMSELCYENGAPIPLEFTEILYTYPSAQVYSTALNTMLDTHNYSGSRWISKDTMDNYIRSSGIIKTISEWDAGVKINFINYYNVRILKYPSSDHHDFYLPSKIGLRRTKLQHDIRKCLLDTTTVYATRERVWIGAEREENRKLDAYIERYANNPVSYDVDLDYIKPSNNPLVKVIHKNTKRCPSCNIRITCGQDNPDWRGIECKECRERVCMACGVFTKNCKGHKCNCQSSRCYDCSGYIEPQTVYHSHTHEGWGGGGGGMGMGLGLGMLAGASIAGGFG